MMRYVQEMYPEAIPCGECKTLEAGFMVVTLHGRVQWVLWLNIGNDTHLISEDEVLKDCNYKYMEGE